jgi:Family of unknown function (DUF5706)
MDCDKLWKVLDSVQAQIRVFDTKAQIVIAIDGVLAGFFGTQTVKMAELIGQRPGSIWSILLVAFAVGCIALLLSSLLLAVNTVHPRLHLDQPNSRLFFAHIFQEFKRDYSRAGEVLTSLTVDELGADLANQILVNSIICCTKAKRFKHALYAMSAAVIVWILVLFMQFARQEEVVLGVAPPLAIAIRANQDSAANGVEKCPSRHCICSRSASNRQHNFASEIVRRHALNAQIAS